MTGELVRVEPALAWLRAPVARPGFRGLAIVARQVPGGESCRALPSEHYPSVTAICHGKGLGASGSRVLTQEQVAARMGVSVARVSEIERGRRLHS